MNTQWKANQGITYIDDGVPFDPRSRSSQRHVTSEQTTQRSRQLPAVQPKTTRFVQHPVEDVIDDMDDEYYITVTPEESNDMSVGPDYARKPFRRHHTDTDPYLNYTHHPRNESDVRTAPSQRRNDERTVRVDVSRKGKKGLTFYFSVISGALVTGAVAWFLFVAPAIHHYHVGDNPIHQYSVAMGGEKCLATATMNGEVIDIMIAPLTFASKVHPEVQVAQYRGDAGPHEVILETDLDVNGDGRTDIIVSVDGRQVGVLLANSDGSGYHWSKS